MGRVNLKAGDEQIESWKRAAEVEQLSLSAWARRVLSAEAAGRRGSVQQGERTAKPDPSPESRVLLGTPETLARDFSPESLLSPVESEPPAAEAPAREFKPDPKQGAAKLRAELLKKPSLAKVLSTGAGTVSASQSVKALEAERLKQSRAEAFSMVCPLRNEHVAGVRCSHCHGIA